VTTPPPLLSIRKLSLKFETSRGAVHVLRNVDLDLPRGRIVGLVGESGSGKTTLALAILRLLPVNAGAPQGQIVFDGVDLLSLPESEMRRVRGRQIAMIFQDPMSALNPVFTLQTQLLDVQRGRVGELSRREMRRRASGLLKRVGIADVPGRLSGYPHQLSGGMRQRVMIAMALLMEPDLLIADEPTSALDATIAAQIVELIADLRKQFAGSILLISHSLGLIAELCDDVIVMYAGEIVEMAPADRLFADPRHPYTRALLACEGGHASGRLPSIPGEVPDLLERPRGCVFAPRCAQRQEQCAESPPTREVAAGHQTACWFP
jgi:oligopeptide/dipeptide ABC transporter ATP-binding protein